MINKSLFDKFNSLEFKPNFNLFGMIDYEEVKRTSRCPWGHKLYPMMSKPLMYCKSKKHKSFVIKKWK